jgi:hypothetical protein
MKELKEEAKRHHDRKLHAYGGCAHRAHGGLAKHPDLKEDEALIRKEVKPGALKHHPHKADGGPIGGGAGPAMGRRRGSGKGKSGKTNVNVIMAGKPGGDGAGAGPLPPMGAAGGLPPMPPRPMPAPAPGLGARPPMAAGPAGPMKRGGAAKKHSAHHHGAHKKVHH